MNQVPNSNIMAPAFTKRRSRCRRLAVGAALSCLSVAPAALAEVKIGEAKGWEVFTSGQVGAFVTYAHGDGYPNAVAPPGQVDENGNPLSRTIVPGAGLVGYQIPQLDANGENDPSQQSRVSQWRVRNGFSPNVLKFRLSKQMTVTVKLNAVMSLWSVIEPPGQQKHERIETNFQEGYGQVETPYGAVTVGRHVSLFSRGIVDMDVKYLHQYAAGYNGHLEMAGPTAGLINFGVLAAFFSPGIMYTSPRLAGFQLNVGLYDPVVMAGALWEITRTPRPEFEATWAYESAQIKAGTFVNGAIQKLYRGNDDTQSATALGLGFGGHFEYGPFHVGAGGHYGKGLGLAYALEASPTTVGPAPLNELRTFAGFSAFAQYSPGAFDINVGGGQSRVFELEVDKTGPESRVNSLIKTQTAVAAAFVYHFSDRFHLDVDFLRAMFRWDKGEKQDVNFYSTGATIQW